MVGAGRRGGFGGPRFDVQRATWRWPTSLSTQHAPQGPHLHGECVSVCLRFGDFFVLECC
jgi:hypothetical protein